MTISFQSPEQLVSYEMTQRVRGLVADYGGRPREITTAQITMVLLKTKDEDIAAYAIACQHPRPGWLAELIPGDKGRKR